MSAYQSRTPPSYAFDITNASFQGTGEPIFGYDFSANYIPPTSLEISLRHVSKFHQFTGQERDSESTPSLDYFNARYMASVLGRFASPDPGNAGADISNPQPWNAYSYVLGNPLNSVDPDGLDGFDPSDGGGYCDDDFFCGIGIGFDAQLCKRLPSITPQNSRENGDAFFVGLFFR